MLDDWRIPIAILSAAGSLYLFARLIGGALKRRGRESESRRERQYSLSVDRPPEP